MKKFLVLVVLGVVFSVSFQAKAEEDESPARQSFVENGSAVVCASSHVGRNDLSDLLNAQLIEVIRGDKSKVTDPIVTNTGDFWATVCVKVDGKRRRRDDN